MYHIILAYLPIGEAWYVVSRCQIRAELPAQPRRVLMSAAELGRQDIVTAIFQSYSPEVLRPGQAFNETVACGNMDMARLILHHARRYISFGDCADGAWRAARAGHADIAIWIAGEYSQLRQTIVCEAAAAGKRYDIPFVDISSYAYLYAINGGFAELYPTPGASQQLVYDAVRVGPKAFNCVRRWNSWCWYTIGMTAVECQNISAIELYITRFGWLDHDHQISICRKHPSLMRYVVNYDDILLRAFLTRQPCIIKNILNFTRDYDGTVLRLAGLYPWYPVSLLPSSQKIMICVNGSYKARALWFMAFKRLTTRPL